MRSASAQVASPSGLGKRLRDDKVPTQVVRGKLVDLQRNGLIVETDGKQNPIGFNRDTVVELGAKGPREFLTVGAVVAVSGEMQMDGSVTLRDHGWGGIEVYVAGPPKQQVDRGWEMVYTAKAGSPILPFRFVGTVISMDPLVVRPLTNYRQPTLAVEVPGKPLQKLPDIKNRELTIEVPKEDGMIKLNLGERVDLIGSDAQVTATVAFYPNPIAQRVYIERSEPIKRNDVPDDEKAAKGKKGSKNAGKSTKSGKAPAKSNSTAKP
ncbi:MAG: hypothetical protein AB7O26_17405 [Planctomycetaceae bacterium]